MNAISGAIEPIVGLNVPAAVGMRLEDVHTPALIIDLDTFERNIKRMRALAEKMGVRHRAHAKTHKSADIAHIQMQLGRAVGVCCQKVSEAEAIVDGGISDVLVSNQVVDEKKIDRLAQLAGRARILVCVDDSGNIDDLSKAAVAHGTMVECLVEIDCGAGRCGVQWGEPVLELARKIDKAPGLKFSGLQSYQGAAQHVHNFDERKAKIDSAIEQVRVTIRMLNEAGLDCDIVGGAGTGSYYFEGTSGVYNELQCGSYIFMDADYQRVLDADGAFIHEFENSLFIWTSVMSKTKTDKAICDAGLKAQSVDSGLPTIFGRDDVSYVKCSDEHGVIADPDNVLRLNEKLKLVPGHCDPTCNVHDWYVGIRNGRVECLWPVTARGLAY
ncbi:DSD1 family PLP-dependent enzyme [Pseudohoeflea coraliihabitans]|uniref:DSD1 family PLP-dependent enzyme n=1 Tax=Pseudohoeflea coraliihabitans TaxID=2860393 RepID=A0ABS6WQT7_9HYPH|nr:DSD1 family PLP-dependent enzyme [Pseudohoeflea sp. DP4N28-3]MBW3098334.1 DSD1 family PLP-dependent enzyme [Pseudohoeflea sp. DP4N28-3]